MSPYYQDDYVTIYHGDCLGQHWTWTGADVLVTDPPYGIGWTRGVNAARGSKEHAGILNDGDTSARDEAVAVWGTRPAIVFGSLYAPPPDGVRHVLIWEKPPDAGVVGATTGYRRDIEAVFLLGEWPHLPVRWGSVLRSRTPSAGNPWSNAGRTGHPHAKPIDLLAQLIERGPPGTVADPFCGAGGALLAAKSLGRRAVGIEIEERYCEIAAERCRQEVLDFGAA